MENDCRLAAKAIAATFLKGEVISIIPPGSGPIDEKSVSEKIYKKESFKTRRTAETDLLMLFAANKSKTINGDLCLMRGENIGLKISSYSPSHDHVGIKMHRLLSVALNAFTSGSIIHLDNSCLIHLSLSEYAYAVNRTHYANFDNKKLAERKKEDCKLMRREISAILKTLEKTEIVNSTECIPIASRTHMTYDDIMIEFDSRFVSHIASDRKTISRYPTALLSFDARSPLTYALGEWLYGYSTFRSSIRKMKRTDDTKRTFKLKIDKLLTHLPICDADDTAIKNYGWKARIRIPLENALKRVTDAGLIDDWNYMNGQVPLKKETTDFSDLKSYLNTFVLYTIVRKEENRQVM